MDEHKKQPKKNTEKMTLKECEKSCLDMIKLISCILCDEVPEKAWCETLNLKELYIVAKHHLMDAITAEALEKAGIQDSSFREAKANAVRKSLLFDAERKKITAEFEKHGIWYVLLKGAVLQDYYPGYGLRQMSDNDILIDETREEDVKCTMESLGYETVEYGETVHDVYYKEPVLCFEMHKNLFADYHKKNLYGYYRNLEERLQHDQNGKRERRFSTEDFYIYLIAHEYKHYSREGIGLRALLDTYLFIKQESVNWDYVATETEKLNLADFEEENRSLAMSLFGRGELTEKEKQMLSYFIASGQMGSYENFIKNNFADYGKGKLEYVAHRIFVPFRKSNEQYKFFERRYPFFYKHKVLLPFLPVYRLFNAIKSGRLKKEISTIKSADVKE